MIRSSAVERSGQTLADKYLLLQRIGKGGMGEVWEGEHVVTGRRVAVKILGEAHLANAKVVARFGREARAASAVQHPGIVEILDQDVTPTGEPFLVMEFLAGESLGERIKHKQKLSEAEMLAVVLPLLEALEVAHAAGVVHRDLKPDNVFLLPPERGVEPVKILDFGISRKADELAHHLTQVGSVLGTPHYMSPEQARGELEIDGRVDLYALGVLMYECVTGAVPFDAKNYNALLQRILSEQPPPPRARGAQISAAMEAVIARAMAKSMYERPESAQALRAALITARGARITPAQGMPAARAKHSAADLALGDERELLLEHAARAPAPKGARLDAFDHALAPVLTIGDGMLDVLAEKAPSAEPAGDESSIWTRMARGGEEKPRAPEVAAAQEPPKREDARPAVEHSLDVDVIAPLRTQRAAVVGGTTAIRGLSAAQRRAPSMAPRPARPVESVGPSALWRGVKGALGWLMAGLAIALLAYTGRLVFSRRDAHPARAPAPQVAQPDPAR